MSPFWSQVLFWSVVLAPVSVAAWIGLRVRRDARLEAFFSDLRAEVDAAERAEAQRVEDHWHRYGGLWPEQCVALLDPGHGLRCVGKVAGDGLCSIHLTILEQGHEVRIVRTGSVEGDAA